MQGENSDIVEQRIDFENEIGNIVYVKRIITGTGGERKDRRRRTIESAGNYSTDIFLVSSFDQGSRRSVVRKNSENNFFNSELKDGYYVTFSNEMNASVHTFTLDKLRHFSMYLITVQACRDSSDTNFNVDEYCSNVVVKSRRTEKRVDADNIEALTYQKVSNSKSNMSSMKLKWEEPKNPNGLILKYAVIYKQVGLEYAFPIEQCVTRHMHANLSGEIPLLLLPKGNYSISVRATSLAGNGKRSSPIYFVSNGSYFNFNKIQPIQIVAMSVLLCISSLRK
ncbi:Insulin receptor [Pseudolycoriella hygida]|uniref:Insulin receptor n=1 Tax=Pseudolycoriella hygida TaxID=35572 RepID=A0A9Q0MLM2_9DIPT|nr:Insulin receptor [Pseudolycoriella hygida]